MNPEIFNAILTIIGALLLFMLGALIKKLNDKTKERVKLVLDIVEGFIKANPDMVSEPWGKFKKKVEKYFEKYVKVDLTDEQWALFWETLYDVYKKLKEELKTKEEGN